MPFPYDELTDPTIASSGGERPLDEQTDLLSTLGVPRAVAPPQFEASAPTSSVPPPGAYKPILKEALSSFTSDLMFTLSYAMSEGAKYPGGRGANSAMAAAISGPTLRRTMIQEQQEKTLQERLKFNSDLQHKDAETAKLSAEIEQIRAAAKQNGYTLIKRPDGGIRMVYFSP